jgi:hypothetical protein
MTPTDPTPPKTASGQGPTPPGARPDVHAHDRFHAQHGHAEHDGLYNEDVAHEHSDVNVRALLLSAVALAAVVAACAAAVYGLLVVFEGRAAANDRALSPLARQATPYPAADPVPGSRELRLLTNEPQYLERFRAQQAEVLKGIEDAKKQLLQQGLPARADAPTDGWLGTRSPARGESSGGRAIPLQPGGQGDAAAQQPAPPAGEPKAEPAPAKSGGH